MRNNLINDVKTAVNVFGEIRKARKSGADAVEIKTQPVKSIPVIQCGFGFYDTVEGCTLSNCGKEIRDTASELYNQLPYEVKQVLGYVPKDGEFTARVQIWRELLGTALPPKLYRKAMFAIIHWFIHIKHIREEGASV